MRSRHCIAITEAGLRFYADEHREARHVCYRAAGGSLWRQN